MEYILFKSNNVDESKLIQTTLFNYGFHCNIGNYEIKNVFAPYLYAEIENKVLSYSDWEYAEQQMKSNPTLYGLRFCTINDLCHIEYIIKTGKLFNVNYKPKILVL